MLFSPATMVVERILQVSILVFSLGHGIALITTDGCGVTKTCFQNPDGCSLADPKCRFLSWKKGSDYGYEFEMSGGSGGGEEYIAFAFGLTNEMETADLYYCDGTRVRSGVIQERHQLPQYLEMEDGLATVSANTVNGVGQCVLRRPASVTKTTSSSEKHNFDITTGSFYLLLAEGRMAAGGRMTKHDWRSATSYKINFSEPLKQPEITSDGCGSTKNCFKDPENCDVSDAGCRYFSWAKGDEGTYTFEMSGGTGDGKQYIAFALGLANQMKDADLYYCDGTAVRTGSIQKLHNPPAYSEMTGGLATKSASTVNGVAKCAFTRPVSVTKTISDGVQKDFDISKEEFHLLGAIGPMDGTHVMKHNVWATVTNNTIKFASEIQPNKVTDDGCGSIKNCFKDPANCDVSDSGCRYFSWMKGEEGTYTFEMSGGTGGGKQYIAMALGLENQMKDADLYYCDGTAVRTGAIQDLHQPPAYYEMTGGLATKSASTENGVAKCAFTRPASVIKTISGGDQKDFDITKEEFHLLGAIGPMTGSHIMKHNVWITVTNDTINFASEIRQNEVTDNGCGSTKNCFKDPADCDISEAGCRYFSWTKGEEGTYTFEMSGGSGGGKQYIAMALGLANQMKDADLYYCDGAAVRSGAIQDLHKSPAYLEMSGGLATKSAMTVNGVAKCSFTRPASVTKPISGGDKKDFDITKEEFYLLGAIGPMNGSEIDKHNVWRTVTNNTINFANEIERKLITTEGCGTFKTCHQLPENCKFGNVDCYFYSWSKMEDDSFHFEILGNIGKGNRYIALALGTEDKEAISDADIYYCDGIAIRSGVIAESHETPLVLEMEKGIETVSATTVNGFAHCILKRPASVTKIMSGGKPKNFDLNQEKYYLLGLAGNMNGTRVLQHTWAGKSTYPVVGVASKLRWP